MFGIAQPFTAVMPTHDNASIPNIFEAEELLHNPAVLVKRATCTPLYVVGCTGTGCYDVTGWSDVKCCGTKLFDPAVSTCCSIASSSLVSTPAGCLESLNLN